MGVSIKELETETAICNMCGLLTKLQVKMTEY